MFIITFASLPSAAVPPQLIGRANSSPCEPSSVPALCSQDKFLCLAVVQGLLKVFYDFSGDLVELSPRDSSIDLKISNADPKAVRSDDGQSFLFSAYLHFLNSSSLPFHLFSSSNLNSESRPPPPTPSPPALPPCKLLFFHLGPSSSFPIFNYSSSFFRYSSTPSIPLLSFLFPSHCLLCQVLLLLLNSSSFSTCFCTFSSSSSPSSSSLTPPYLLLPSSPTHHDFPYSNPVASSWRSSS